MMQYRFKWLMAMQWSSLGLVVCAGCIFWVPASAVHAQSVPVVRFEWADRDVAANVLGTLDAYVQQTGQLERMAKTRRSTTVETPEFLDHMRASAKAWSQPERERVEKLVGSLQSMTAHIAVRQPERVLLVRAGASLEDNLPHTRGNAIVLTDSAFAKSDDYLLRVLVHEYFHVLTRHNAAFREAAYGLLGFQRCDRVVVHPDLQALRITNPDTPVSEHVLTIQRNGQQLHLLPYLVFDSSNPDTHRGFVRQLSFPWLAVERFEGVCSFSASSPKGLSLVPSQTPEVLERVGRNTEYLFHPEEVLADSFVFLFQVQQEAKTVSDFPSPHVLEMLKTLLSTKD
jgi:hypothetical protein